MVRDRNGHGSGVGFALHDNMTATLAHFDKTVFTENTTNFAS